MELMALLPSTLINAKTTSEGNPDLLFPTGDFRDLLNSLRESIPALPVKEAGEEGPAETSLSAAINIAQLIQDPTSLPSMILSEDLDLSSLTGGIDPRGVPQLMATSDRPDQPFLSSLIEDPSFPISSSADINGIAFTPLAQQENNKASTGDTPFNGLKSSGRILFSNPGEESLLFSVPAQQTLTDSQSVSKGWAWPNLLQEKGPIRDGSNAVPPGAGSGQDSMGNLSRDPGERLSPAGMIPEFDPAAEQPPLGVDGINFQEKILSNGKTQELPGLFSKRPGDFPFADYKMDSLVPDAPPQEMLVRSHPASQDKVQTDLPAEGEPAPGPLNQSNDFQFSDHERDAMVGLKQVGKEKLSGGSESIESQPHAELESSSRLFMKPEGFPTAEVEAKSSPSAGVPKEPSDIYRQVGKEMLHSLRNQEEKVRLTLDPPQLGHLNIEIKRDHENIRATLWTDNPVTKEILETQQVDLHRMLREDGFKLDKFDVFFQQGGGFQERKEAPTALRQGASGTYQGSEETYSDLPVLSSTGSSKYVDFFV